MISSGHFMENGFLMELRRCSFSDHVWVFQNSWHQMHNGYSLNLNTNLLWLHNEAKMNPRSHQLSCTFLYWGLYLLYFLLQQEVLNCKTASLSQSYCSRLFFILVAGSGEVSWCNSCHKGSIRTVALHIGEAERLSGRGGFPELGTAG